MAVSLRRRASCSLVRSSVPRCKSASALATASAFFCSCVSSFVRVAHRYMPAAIVIIIAAVAVYGLESIVVFSTRIAAIARLMLPVINAMAALNSMTPIRVVTSTACHALLSAMAILVCLLAIVILSASSETTAASKPNSILFLLITRTIEASTLDRLAAPSIHCRYTG